MAKRCPITSEKVLYLTCLECEQKGPCQSGLLKEMKDVCNNEPKGGVNVSQPTKDVICFDLETSGLDARYEGIIEIGAVNITTGEKFSTFCNPGKRISKRIEELTGITNEMLQDAIPQKEAILKFFEFVGDNAVLCGHNLSFDCRMLTGVCARLHIKHPVIYFIDTLPISRKLLPELKNHKLGSLCEHYGVINKAAHRAIEDVIANVEVYKKMQAEAYQMAKEEAYLFDTGNELLQLFEPVKYISEFDKPTEKQKKYLAFLLDKRGLNEDIESMTKDDASKRILELLEEENERAL